MADLIDRQAAIDALCNDLCGGNHNCRFYPNCDNLKPIQVLPSAERHGTWSEDGGELKCSECHSIFFNDIMDMNKDEMPSFCPVCGARMDGEHDE